MTEMKLNFVKLVEKNVKEGQEGEVAIAKRNAPILKSKMEAKVKALEAQELEVTAELNEAEETLAKTMATNTKDIDSWISLVRQAESDRDSISLKLNSIQKSIEWHNERISFFA